ncbi:zinc ribbon domain-containing protein [Tenacibaculum finnmarkense]|uniref:zinc ribbon domain-containing protein n=1 Tax=Tenacibaculum finnmarkense TaxID=2781243 RepID=UPI001EFC009A|nr:zinc ribbon domain-containing protein [Tenacibaculum finnmarkense]MCG8755561.1 hypothetical protein [Tenacibaculum finnmarkense]MCG8784119.1 hypothetical protein [Tenacibaculum finnmarkense]
MNLNIPDSIPKLLVFIGLFLIGFSFYKSDLNYEKLNQEIEKAYIIKDTLRLQKLILKREVNLVKEKSDYLSKKYSVENPISFNDSIMSFKRNFNGNRADLIVLDSMQKNWNDYSNLNFKVDLTIQKLDNSNRNSKSKIKIFNEEEEYLGDLKTIGFVCFLMGIFGWTNMENKKNKNAQGKSEKIYTFCQSCGEQFSSMLNFGTEKNKELNKAFCENCYKKGKFTNPSLTKKDFKIIYANKIKDLGIIKRQLLRGRFYELERWKDDNF